jgi:hypothetical protein
MNCATEEHDHEVVSHRAHRLGHALDDVARTRHGAGGDAVDHAGHQEQQEDQRTIDCHQGRAGLGQRAGRPAPGRPLRPGRHGQHDERRAWSRRLPGRSPRRSRSPAAAPCFGISLCPGRTSIWRVLEPRFDDRSVSHQPSRRSARWRRREEEVVRTGSRDRGIDDLRSRLRDAGQHRVDRRRDQVGRKTAGDARERRRDPCQRMAAGSVKDHAPSGITST